MKEPWDLPSMCLPLAADALVSHERLSCLHCSGFEGKHPQSQDRDLPWDVFPKAFRGWRPPFSLTPVRPGGDRLLGKGKSCVCVCVAPSPPLLLPVRNSSLRPPLPGRFCDFVVRML